MVRILRIIISGKFLGRGNSLKMKSVAFLIVMAGLVFASLFADAQTLGRRDKSPGRHGSTASPQSAMPEPGTVVLFASGAAPIALYALRRYRRKK